MARLIDADKMLSEVRQVAQILSENAFTHPGVLNILRNWVCRQPTEWLPVLNKWGYYNIHFRILAWAPMIYPDIPADLHGRVTWYFGEEIKND